MCGIEVVVRVFTSCDRGTGKSDSLSDQGIDLYGSRLALSMSSNGLSTILTVNYALRGTTDISSAQATVHSSSDRRR